MESLQRQQNHQGVSSVPIHFPAEQQLLDSWFSSLNCFHKRHKLSWISTSFLPYLFTTDLNLPFFVLSVCFLSLFCQLTSWKRKQKLQEEWVHETALAYLYLENALYKNPTSHNIWSNLMKKKPISSGQGSSYMLLNYIQPPYIILLISSRISFHISRLVILLY